MDAVPYGRAPVNRIEKTSKGVVSWSEFQASFWSTIMQVSLQFRGFSTYLWPFLCLPFHAIDYKLSIYIKFAYICHLKCVRGISLGNLIYSRTGIFIFKHNIWTTGCHNKIKHKVIYYWPESHWIKSNIYLKNTIGEFHREIKEQL